MSTDLELRISRPGGDRSLEATAGRSYGSVVIPSLLFIVPALVGHPAIDADNLIQNFPLRVLAGRQLATCHLPLLDPLTNSGTPLLGGMNAGALYPLTVLLCRHPAPRRLGLQHDRGLRDGRRGHVRPVAVWHRVCTVPAFVAGISYAYCGAMIGQMVHLGVVQGYSFIPWGMLLMLALSRRLTQLGPAANIFQLARVGLPWAFGLAALWGMTFLSGEPRTISSIELLTIVVVPCVLILRSSYWLNSWRLRVAYIATLAVGFAWGLGIGLIQLLPGGPSSTTQSATPSVTPTLARGVARRALERTSLYSRSLWR